jgi:hypothetical protein
MSRVTAAGAGAGVLGDQRLCPDPVWLWLNGHEWAKRQLAKAGIGFAALDNGFASCEDPDLLQRMCDRLGAGAVTGFFWRWFHRLLSPFRQDDLRAGYVSSWRSASSRSPAPGYSTGPLPGGRSSRA